jgi:hypothetical protein
MSVTGKAALGLAALARVSPEIATLYQGMEGYEFQFAPNGMPSGLCFGLATAAHAGGRVTLRRCGLSSRTIRIGNIAFHLAPLAPLEPKHNTYYEKRFVPS